MLSIDARSKETFLRNEFLCVGKWDIPLVKNQELQPGGVDLISYTDTKTFDTAFNTSKGVHFFIDDYHMDGIYRCPERSLKKLSQYKFLCTPDYSLYGEMSRAIQIHNVFRNRYVGAYWQSKGLLVIPTISWSTARSFDFCFDGVENNAIVAISTIGCKKSATAFLRGYNKMLEVIEPSKIICYGSPLPQMEGNLVCVDYLSSRKVIRNGR